MITKVTIKGKEYSLVLDIKSLIQLEKRLGSNPLAAFMNVEEALPTYGQLATIFQAALTKFHHGMDDDKALDLLNDYFEDGNGYTELIQLIMQIYKDSGIIPKEETKTKKAGKEKN